MGAIRIDKTDGSADFINMEGYSQATVAGATENLTQLDLIKLDGTGTDSIDINRFNTTDPAGDGVIWPLMMKAAYYKISIEPVEYGYPILGALDYTTYKEYIRYDVSKIGDNVLNTALSGDTSLDNVWSERTAISNIVTSKDQGEEVIAEFETAFGDFDTARQAAIKACEADTGAGNPYNGACGDVEPLDGGVNTAGCEECANALFETQVAGILGNLGDISWRHQYIFADETEGPAEEEAKKPS